MIITGCSYKKLTNQFLMAYNHLRLRLRYYRIFKVNSTLTTTTLVWSYNNQ